MTIAVYRLNRETGVRTPVRERYSVKPLDAPEVGRSRLTCACPRCEGGVETLRAKLAEVNRRSREEV